MKNIKFNSFFKLFLVVFSILFISSFKTEVFAATGIKTSQRIEIINHTKGKYEAYPTPTYNINNVLYFNLDDIAYILKKYPIMFDYKYDFETKEITINKGGVFDFTYSPWGENNEGIKQLSNMKEEVFPTKTTFIVNGIKTTLNGYSNMYGEDYFKLDDMGKLLGFNVQFNPKNKYYYINYNANNNIVILDGYIEETPVGMGDGRWSGVINSYIYDNKNNTFTILNASDGIVSIMTYNSSNFKMLNKKTIKYELPKFGGFLSGNKYNWIVFGESSTKETEDKEVLRIVKYDKQFNRLGSVSLTGKQTFTQIPFDAGSLRMAESPTELAIITSRERYDGHQSNLPIILDIETMSIKNNISAFPENHVSHSFNQFVKYDGRKYEGYNDLGLSWAFLEHGDAYPRGIALNIVEVVKEKHFDPQSNKWFDSSFDVSNENVILDVPGSIGANTTGINIGGFEITNQGHLTAINSVNFDNVKEFGTYSIEYKDSKKNERDIVLISNDMNGKATTNKITNYFGTGKTASIPKLLKISDNKFMVIWQEFGKSTSLKYTFVNEKGILIDKIYDKPDFRMSNVEPIILNNNVVLPVGTTQYKEDKDSYIILYRIPLK